MNALSNKLGNFMAFVNEFAVPESGLVVISPVHEALFLDESREIIEKIGGSLEGHHTFLEDSKAINSDQFEAGEKEDYA